MPKPFTLTIAPNGARLGPEDHPELPITARELAITARRCQEAGAGAIHMHVRDADARHSLHVGTYRDAIAAVMANAPGMDIQITTEAAGMFDVAAQLACLETLKPEWASVAVAEMARDPDLARQLYAFADQSGVRIQHILYSPEDVRLLASWFDKGIVQPGQRDTLFVLGSYARARAGQPSDLAPFLAAAQGLDLNWSVCAFGRNEQACLLAALEKGGDVRIGFENNMTAPDGSVFADNAASVAALVHKAAVQGFTPRKASI